MSLPILTSSSDCSLTHRLRNQSLVAKLINFILKNNHTTKLITYSHSDAVRRLKLKYPLHYGVKVVIDPPTWLAVTIVLRWSSGVVEGMCGGSVGSRSQWLTGQRSNLEWGKPTSLQDKPVHILCCLLTKVETYYIIYPKAHKSSFHKTKNSWRKWWFDSLDRHFYEFIVILRNTFENSLNDCKLNSCKWQMIMQCVSLFSRRSVGDWVLAHLTHVL